MTAETLRVRGVSYRYPGGDWTLRDASFSLVRGEILGIIGPNGSGKSTLLKLAAGVLTPDLGDVSLGGLPMKPMNRREVARLLGYLPQDSESSFDFPVRDVVAMGRFSHLKGAGFLNAADLEVVNRCMEQTNTSSYRDRMLTQLSGGERQRVMLASVLAQEPEVLLLDEPTSALDIHQQVSFFGLLSKLALDGMGAAVVTHDLNLASLFSDRVVLMDGGRIVRVGPPEEIITEPLMLSTYGEGLVITTHPAHGRPVVLPSRDRGNRKGY